MIILTVRQPDTQHNCSHIESGPDGYLFIGLGHVGENPYEPETEVYARSFDSLLGTIFRLDINASWPYSIPEDNPYYGGKNLTEIWTYRLRNPWRFSIDPLTGSMFITDIGHSNRHNFSSDQIY